MLVREVHNPSSMYTTVIQLFPPTVVTVQFTQPEYTVSEADRILILTVDKRGTNFIPLQVTITVNSMSATGKGIRLHFTS